MIVAFYYAGLTIEAESAFHATCLEFSGFYVIGTWDQVIALKPLWRNWQIKSSQHILGNGTLLPASHQLLLCHYPTTKSKPQLSLEL